MATKMLKSKLGSNSSDLEKLKKENETLKKTLEEMSKSKEKSDAQRKVEDTKKVESANNLNILESQLKDALEKNQKWLVYDQQREEYVKGLMGRIYDLEQQLGNANKTIQQQGKDTPSEAKQDDDKQKHYDKLLLAAKKDLDNERKITAQLSAQLSAMKAERDGERRAYKEKKQKLRAELEVSKQKIEEEKQRTIELTNQIQAISVSLLKQHEQQSRIAALEQQKNTSNIFNNVPSCTFHNDLEEKLTIRSQRSPPHRRSLLDESFLECPNCKAMYPASQHRELLAHIDFCTS